MRSSLFGVFRELSRRVVYIMASLFIAKPSACMAVYVYEVHDDSPFLSLMASSMPLELGFRKIDS